MLVRCLIKLKNHWFIVTLVTLIALAKLQPSLGRKEGILHPEYTVKYAAVSYIFFSSGLLLKSEDLSSAVMHWKLHVFIQGFTLLCMPALTYRLCLVLGWTDIDEWLIKGLQVVGCMPPPVSSAVILTKAVGGNEAGAIFNSAFGSFLGIFITPLLLLRYLGSQADVDVMSVFSQLSVTVVIPLLIGQLVRPRLRLWLQTTSCPFGVISSATLLLIIYCTFCDTFSNEDLNVDPFSLFYVIFIILILQCFILFLTHKMSTLRLLGFSPADSIAAMYCSTHKSLTLGIPMLKILFSGNENLSIIAIPLLIYHPTQIVLGGVLVAPMRRWLARQRRKWDTLRRAEV